MRGEFSPRTSEKFLLNRRIKETNKNQNYEHYNNHIGANP
jgi:hypothetical protein